MNEPRILELAGVCMDYAAGSRKLSVLRGVDLQAAPGEWISLTGASGSGKTTLLHLLGLLEKPTSGTICVCGQDYAALKPAAAAEFRRKRIGFVFQNYCLLPELTVLENIVLPGMMNGMSASRRLRKAGSLAERMGLAGRLTHRPAELSGGEQQRTAIARALINSPEILLADEPTGNLDRQTGSDILALFRELRAEGEIRTIVMITHDPAVACAADRSLTLRDGILTPA